MKETEALPSEPLRRRLAAIGIPAERHGLEELRRLLPGEPSRLDADSMAEVVIYLVGKKVLQLPPPRLEVPLGRRRCAHYSTREELVALLAPWFRDGIADNERCIWLVSTPLTSSWARQAIAGFGDLRAVADRLEIFDAGDWGDSWEREQERALAQGYSGLRVCADMKTIHERAPGPWSRQLCTHNGKSK